MPVWAVAITPSPIFKWPATPTCPARVTRSPMVELPATPTWPARTVSRPTVTEWPICTRLSSLVPRPVPQAAALAHQHPRVEDAVLAYLYVLVEHHVGMDDRARADPGACSHHGQGGNVHALAEGRGGMDHRRGVHARRRRRLRVQEHHRSREGEVRVVRQQAGERGRDRGVDDDGRGLGGPEPDR